MCTQLLYFPESIHRAGKNPLVRSPWRVPHAAGRVEILTVSNVIIEFTNTYGDVG